MQIYWLYWWCWWCLIGPILHLQVYSVLFTGGLVVSVLILNYLYGKMHLILCQFSLVVKLLRGLGIVIIVCMYVCMKRICNYYNLNLNCLGQLLPFSKNFQGVIFPFQFLSLESCFPSSFIKGNVQVRCPMIDDWLIITWRALFSYDRDQRYIWGRKEWYKSPPTHIIV